MVDKHNELSTQTLSETGRSRRRLLGQTGGVIATFALSSSLSQAEPNTPATASAVDDPQKVKHFLKYSRFITGHQNLDTTLGERLFQAFNQQDPQFSDKFNQLADWIEQHKTPDVETLDSQLANHPLHDVMMSVIKGWYLGVTDESHHAKVYGYQSALMYQVPRDGMVIPTYAHNGPDYWQAEPPPVDRLLTF